LTRDLKLYLDDMLKSLEEIEEFMKGLSFDDFCKSTQVIRAVTMDLIIVGEAAKHVPAEMRKSQPQIPWSKIVGMRNILTHNYPEADTEIIWKTVKKRLPELLLQTTYWLVRIQRLLQLAVLKFSPLLFDVYGNSIGDVTSQV
jgi:uncharacterized protein with HEPN domain